MLTTQLDHIITQANLKQAFEEISQNSSGLDDVSYSEFKKDIYDNIDELCTQIISGTYSPEPLKKNPLSWTRKVCLPNHQGSSLPKISMKN